MYRRRCHYNCCCCFLFMIVCEVSLAHFLSNYCDGTEKSRTQLEQMSFNDGKASYLALDTDTDVMHEILYWTIVVRSEQIWSDRFEWMLILASKYSYLMVRKNWSFFLCSVDVMICRELEIVLHTFRRLLYYLFWLILYVVSKITMWLFQFKYCTNISNSTIANWYNYI